MSLVALTGASGFLGRHIAQALLKGQLRAVVRSPAKVAELRAQGAEVAEADLSDLPALTLAFTGARTVVANAALGSHLGDMQDFVRTNVQGTENTLRAAAAAGVPAVVLISSTGVYRTRLGHILGEDAERYGTRPWRSWSDLSTDWRYSLTKHLAEERAWTLAKELGIALTVLRPGPIYGSRDTRWTARFMRAYGRPVAFAPTIGIPMVHAGDVADAVVAAIAQPTLAGRAFNLAGPPTSIVTIMRTLTRINGRGPFIVPIPLPFWVAYDTTAAHRHLNFRSRPLEEGLREVVAAAAGG